MKKNIKKFAALLLALAMILVLAGCGGSKDNGKSAENWDRKITIVQSSDVIGFDPTASTDTNNKNVLKNMVSRLYETDDYFNPVSVLATSYSQIDNYTWEFKIAQGVKFHDGSTMTVDDVIYSLQRAKEKSSSGKTLLGPVASFEKVDEETLRITTSTVYGSLLTALSNSACTILSQKWIEKAEAGECDWDEVMRQGATGRYILGERKIGNSVTLIKNENYFDPNDAAQNDLLEFRIIPEATTRTVMVQTGEADVNVNFDTAQMDECKADPNVEVLEHESSTIYYIALNREKGPFTSKELRQAVAYAINRADCLEVGYNSYGKVWSNVWAPTVIGAKDDPYTFDQAKATELVQKSGYNGEVIKACVKTDAEERIAQTVKDNLSKVGINMTYSRIDNTILTEVMANNEYDMAFDYTAFYSDPELFVGRQFQASGIGAKNYAHYTNAEVDELMIKAKATLDEAERAEIYHQINQILCDDCPWIGMFNSNLYALAHKGVSGVNINVETTYWYNTICYK